MENPPPTKARYCIAIVVLLLLVASSILFVWSHPEFRHYLIDESTDAFYAAKESVETIEFLVILAIGLIGGAWLAFDYMFKSIPKENRGKFLEFLNEEKWLGITGLLILIFCFLIYAPYVEYRKIKTQDAAEAKRPCRKWRCTSRCSGLSAARRPGAPFIEMPALAGC
jgi:hypothetical protein